MTSTSHTARKDEAQPGSSPDTGLCLGSQGTHSTWLRNPSQAPGQHSSLVLPELPTLALMVSKSLLRKKLEQLTLDTWLWGQHT